MGFVYEAVESSTGRRAAVKLIPRDPRAGASSEVRLPREARLAGRVRHPNVVALYDAGVYHGGIYLVMELVTGDSVQSLLTHPLSWRIATEIRDALAATLTGSRCKEVLLSVPIEPREGLALISTRWPLISDPVQFVFRYAPAIRGYLHALLRQPADVDEVLQEFLVAVLERGFIAERVLEELADVGLLEYVKPYLAK